MSGEPAFFELGVADAARARTFYGELFGWRFRPGPAGGDGAMITTSGMPGGLHGSDPGASPLLFFRVDDMGRAIERVHELGGAVEGTDHEDDPEIQETYGRYKLCRDDQGSPFGLYQAPAGGAP